MKKSNFFIFAMLLIFVPSVISAETSSAAMPISQATDTPAQNSLEPSDNPASQGKNLASEALPALTIPIVASAQIDNKSIVLIATDPFHIPPEPPETTINANSLSFKPGSIILNGNVTASRGQDILTCQRAFLNKDPEWMLASVAPRLHRKENLPDKKAERETTLDANNILWHSKDGRIEASDSVIVTIEEKTWDLATYSKVLISANYMEGFRESQHLRFSGNVKINDKTRFGQGDNLDYDKASSTATLTGNARVETEKWNQKEKKMEKDIITGEIITYNFDTKQANSE